MVIASVGLFAYYGIPILVAAFAIALILVFFVGYWLTGGLPSFFLRLVAH